MRNAFEAGHHTRRLTLLLDAVGYDLSKNAAMVEQTTAASYALAAVTERLSG